MQPATRWALPEPSAIVADGDRSAWVPAQPPSDSTVDVLMRLLMADLRRRHFNVAMRHFLMLKASGASVPVMIERRCEELLQNCPTSRRNRITRDIARWARMVQPLRVA